MYWLIVRITYYCLLLNTTNLSEPTIYTLEDGSEWIAEIGQHVHLELTDNGKKTQVDGVIVRLRESIVKVSGEYVIVKHVTSVTIINSEAVEENQLIEDSSQNATQKKQPVDKKKKNLEMYVVVPLVGEVGIVPIVSGQKYSTQFISSVSVEEMLRRFKKIKNLRVKHVVFVIESAGGNNDDIENMRQVLDAFRKTFDYHLVVSEKGNDPLQIATLCKSVTVCPDYIRGDYEQAKVQYDIACKRFFWKALKSTSFCGNVWGAMQETVANFSGKEVLRPVDIGRLESIRDWEEHIDRSKQFVRFLDLSKKSIVEQMTEEGKALESAVYNLQKYISAMTGIEIYKSEADAADPDKITVTYDVIKEELRRPDGSWYTYETKVESQAYKNAWCNAACRQIESLKLICDIGFAAKRDVPILKGRYYNTLKEEILTLTQKEVRESFVKEWDLLLDNYNEINKSTAPIVTSASLSLDYVRKKGQNRNCRCE